MYTEKYVEDFVEEGFEFPEGYPFMLYNVETKTDNKFVIADTPQRAFLITGGGKPMPVRVNELIQSWGHARTHNMLQSCEPHWVVKHNMAFFKNGPRVI